jgi:hypothetical protein
MSFQGRSSTFKNIEIINTVISTFLVNCTDCTFENFTLRDSVLSLSTGILRTRMNNFNNYPGALVSTDYLILSNVAQSIDFWIDNPNVDVWSRDEGTVYQETLTDSSRISVTNNSGAANADFVIKRGGRLTRTGTGLTDTTVYGSNLYAWRFDGNSTIAPIFNESEILIGDQQGYSMFLYAWIKIASANFYAGSTYQLPRLSVFYDNATTSYAQAATATSWQVLIVPITPTTSYPRVKMKLSSFTDATGTDAQWYLGAYGVVLPAGRNVDPGRLGLWAEAAPFFNTPTSLSAFDVWNVPKTQLTGAGSAGELLVKTHTKADDASVLSLL